MWEGRVPMIVVLLKLRHELVPLRRNTVFRLLVRNGEPPICRALQSLRVYWVHVADVDHVSVGLDKEVHNISFRTG